MTPFQKAYDVIMSKLNSGIRPWSAGDDKKYNFVTGKRYDGLCGLILDNNGPFITESQIKSAGGTVRDGSVPQYGVFSKHIAEANRPSIFYYKLYRVSDVDGLDASGAEAPISRRCHPSLETVLNTLTGFLRDEHRCNDNIKDLAVEIAAGELGVNDDEIMMPLSLSTDTWAEIISSDPTIIKEAAYLAARTVRALTV